MPFFDRFWWLEAIFGVIMAALAPLGCICYWQYAPPEDEQLWLLTTMICTGAITLPVALFTIIGARREYRRIQRRTWALRGVPNAVPYALRPVLHPEHAPDSIPEPISLLQRVEPSLRAMGRLTYWMMWLVAVELAAGIAVLSFFIAGVIGANSFDSPQPIERLLAGAGALVLLALGIADVYVMIRCGPLMQGHPYGIVVRDDGIEHHAASGRSTFIPWHAMRLLEVQDKGSRSVYSVYLYSDLAFAEWSTSTVGLEPQEQGVAPDEMQRRFQMALDTIAARAGLTLRTFSPTLQK